MEESGLVTRGFAGAVNSSGMAMEKATKRSFMLNQGLFMARRGLFYGTLGILGMGAALAKLGFQYDSVTNTATVALQGFIHNNALVKKEVNDLYALAARSPFLFPDIVQGARRLYIFNGSLVQTNQLMQSVINGLSAMGFTTSAALNRATLAFAHMYSIGHLTGQVLLQLNRDNLQMTKALEYYYHQSGATIKQEVSAGIISALDATKAFNAYMNTKGFAGAGFRQATRTLSGAWTTFKDLLGMGAGKAEQGPFDAVRRGLVDVDKALLPLTKGGKPITLALLAQAMDTALSPKTHIIINLFTTFEYALKTVVGLFFVLTKAIQYLLIPFDYLASIFGANIYAAKILGVLIGVLIAAFILEKSVTIGVTLATEAYTAAQWGLGRAIKVTTIWQAIQKAFMEGGGGVAGIKAVIKALEKWAFAEKWVGTGIGETATKVSANQSALAKLTRAFFIVGRAAKAGIGALVTIITESLIPAITGLEVSFATLWAVVWPIGLAVLIVYTLTVLYFRWKLFHDAVNNTAKYLWKNWFYVALIVSLLFPLIQPVILIAKYWKTISGWIQSAYNWAKKLWDVFATPVRAVGGFFGRIGHFIGHVASYASPSGGYYGSHAMGGMVPGGVSLVGERGPELVRLPGGTRITPNSQIQPIGWSANQMNGNEQPIVVQLVVDRKVLAQAVARANQDYRARR
jgi:hypothetical protein